MISPALGDLEHRSPQLKSTEGVIGGILRGLSAARALEVVVMRPSFSRSSNPLKENLT